MAGWRVEQQQPQWSEFFGVRCWSCRCCCCCCSCPRSMQIVAPAELVCCPASAAPAGSVGPDGRDGARAEASAATAHRRERRGSATCAKREKKVGPLPGPTLFKAVCVQLVGQGGRKRREASLSLAPARNCAPCLHAEKKKEEWKQSQRDPHPHNSCSLGLFFPSPTRARLSRCTPPTSPAALPNAHPESHPGGRGAGAACAARPPAGGRGPGDGGARGIGRPTTNLIAALSSLGSPVCCRHCHLRHSHDRPRPAPILPGGQRPDGQ